MDSDCQASGISADVGVQTRWFRKVNSCVQYESLTLQDLNIRSPTCARRDIQTSITHSVCSESDVLGKDNPRLSECVRLLEAAIAQNNTLDVSVNDFGALLDEDVSLGAGVSAGLKEFQSFTDIVYSKNKCVSAIDWHPAGNGVVAVACTDKGNSPHPLPPTFSPLPSPNPPRLTHSFLPLLFISHFRRACSS